jgi:hypothetical protein
MCETATCANSHFLLHLAFLFRQTIPQHRQITPHDYQTLRSVINCSALTHVVFPSMSDGVSPLLIVISSISLLILSQSVFF